MLCDALLARSGINHVRSVKMKRTSLLLVGLFAPVLAGCAGTGGEFLQTDLLSKDANWFSKPGRVFIKNVSIETPPLTPNKPVGAEDLASPDGACAGMPSAAQLAESNAASAQMPGVVALGHTECDIIRSVGAPDNVNQSANERGDRLVVLTYTHGNRPGIYTFTSGRLTMVERAPEPVKPQRPANRRRAG